MIFKTLVIVALIFIITILFLIFMAVVTVGGIEDDRLSRTRTPRKDL
jgi:hypothetical protein